MRLEYSIALAVVLGLTLASPGDQLEEFQNCVKKCDYLTCDESHLYDFTTKELRLLKRQQREYQLFQPDGPNVLLRMLGWNCYDNCDYQCQRIVTKFREQNNEEIFQFHGKWPFMRVCGIQELFSTLFSILNFIPHYMGFLSLKQQLTQLSRSGSGSVELHIVYRNYILILAVTMCAWVSSTIFHLKDTWNREKLDYYFAGLAVLTGFHAISIRVFKLFLEINRTKHLAFTFVCCLLYIYHITRLTIDWSYTYNMQANVFIGLLQNALFIYHGVTSYMALIPSRGKFTDYLTHKDYNWHLTPIVLVLSVCFGMSFELFDFPPLFDLIDAHAIWHFVTIWPLFFWYDYLIRDARIITELKYD